MSEDLAWAGGVLEAKGYANFRPGKAVLRLTDTRKELLVKFHGIAGAGRIYFEKQPKGRLDRWRWETHSRADISDVVDLLAPYLSSGSLERMRGKK